MPIIDIAKPFTLHLPKQIGKDDKDNPIFDNDGERINFTPGLWEVTEEIAKHWYVGPHLVGYVDPGPAPGTQQYAEQALRAAQAARQTVGVQKLGQPAAKLPPDTIPAEAHPQVASRSGMVSEGAHYFAGQPQQDKQIPGSPVSFMATPAGIPQSGPPPPIPPASAQPQPSEIPPFGFKARPVVPQVE
jgi:hypothetical protein